MDLIASRVRDGKPMSRQRLPKKKEKPGSSFVDLKSNSDPTIPGTRDKISLPGRNPSGGRDQIRENTKRLRAEILQLQETRNSLETQRLTTQLSRAKPSTSRRAYSRGKKGALTKPQSASSEQRDDTEAQNETKGDGFAVEDLFATKEGAKFLAEATTTRKSDQDGMNLVTESTSKQLDVVKSRSNAADSKVGADEKKVIPNSSPDSNIRYVLKTSSKTATTEELAKDQTLDSELPQETDLSSKSSGTIFSWISNMTKTTSGIKESGDAESPKKEEASETDTWGAPVGRRFLSKSFDTGRRENPGTTTNDLSLDQVTLASECSDDLSFQGESVATGGSDPSHFRNGTLAKKLDGIARGFRKDKITTNASGLEETTYKSYRSNFTARSIETSQTEASEFTGTTRSSHEYSVSCTDDGSTVYTDASGTTNSTGASAVYNRERSGPSAISRDDEDSLVSADVPLDATGVLGDIVRIVAGDMMQIGSYAVDGCYIVGEAAVEMIWITAPIIQRGAQGAMRGVGQLGSALSSQAVKFSDKVADALIDDEDDDTTMYDTEDDQSSKQQSNTAKDFVQRETSLQRRLRRNEIQRRRAQSS